MMKQKSWKSKNLPKTAQNQSDFDETKSDRFQIQFSITWACSQGLKSSKMKKNKGEKKNKIFLKLWEAILTIGNCMRKVESTMSECLAPTPSSQKVGAVQRLPQAQQLKEHHHRHQPLYNAAVPSGSKRWLPKKLAPQKSWKRKIGLKQVKITPILMKLSQINSKFNFP